MKDPWRLVDPVREPDRPERVDIFDLDRDADLRPHLSCVLRFKACVVEVLSPDVMSARDALELLARCILELKSGRGWEKNLPKLAACGVRAKWGRVMHDVPAGAGHAQLSAEGVSVWFPEQTLDAGALVLVRALMEAGKKPAYAATLRKYGITPMLRAT